MTASWMMSAVPVLIAMVIVAGCKDCEKARAGRSVVARGGDASTGSEIVEDTDTEPAEETLWVRSGKPPTDQMIMDAVGTREGLAPTLLGEGTPVSDGLFMRLIVQPPFVVAMLVSEHEGKAQIESRVKLPIDTLNLDTNAPVVMAQEVLDVDSDDELEVSLALVFDTHPQASGTGSHREQAFILDMDPVPRVAFTTITHTEPLSGAGAMTDLVTKIADADGDGHADIHVSGKQCIGKACTPMDMTYFYNDASDSWAEKQ